MNDRALEAKSLESTHLQEQSKAEQCCTDEMPAAAALLQAYTSDAQA